MSRVQYEYNSLYYALQNGHSECVRLLLEGGANKNIAHVRCMYYDTTHRVQPFLFEYLNAGQGLCLIHRCRFEC